MDFIRSYYFHPRRPSPITRWVGSCITCFEACSAFTHVMACTLAKSPSDPLHRKLRQLRCLRRRFDCYRVERTSSRAGVAPAEAQRLFTAHVKSRCYVNLTCASILQVLRGTHDESLGVIRREGSPRNIRQYAQNWQQQRLKRSIHDPE